ncbi:hypothetical protein [Actinomycetospora flava]|uniref:Phage abortive infection protein n=1 Tax=Actinomycetospora flava TaxID=3129232 RepID=A0ABU8M7C9_9PSEU
MSRLLTWTLRLLWVLGAILFLVGIGVFGRLPEKEDQNPGGWWDTSGYIVNLASGLTAACFGVPIAFFVLQRLLRDRANDDRQLAMVKNAITSLERIERTIYSLSGVRYDWFRTGSIRSLEEEFDDFVRTIEEIVLHARSSGDAGPKLKDANTHRARFDEMNSSLGDSIEVEIGKTRVRGLVELHRTGINAALAAEGLDPTHEELLSKLENLPNESNLTNIHEPFLEVSRDVLTFFSGSPLLADKGQEIKDRWQMEAGQHYVAWRDAFMKLYDDLSRLRDMVDGVDDERARLFSTIGRDVYGRKPSARETAMLDRFGPGKYL